MKKFDFSKEFGNIDPKYISEAEGEWKGKKKAWTPSFWSKLVAACVILALISTVLSNPKVQAAIKNLALSIGETLGFQKEIEPYTEALNISQTDQGITANIKEVVLDEGVLLFRVHAEIDNTEENEKKKTANISSFRNTGITLDMGKTTINGQKLDEYMNAEYSPYSVDDLLDADADSDEKEYDRVQEYRFHAPTDLGENPEIHLVLNAFDYDDWEKSVAEFTFDFNISREKILKQTTNKELENISVQTEEGTVTLKDIFLNKLQSSISADVPEKLFQKYEVELRGTDSKGNKVRYLGYDEIECQKFEYNDENNENAIRRSSQVDVFLAPTAENATIDGTGENIIVTKKSSTDMTKNLIISAHYDSAEDSVGANDNGSGVAAVLELARILKDTEMPYNVKFILFSGEEKYMLGSRWYVGNLSEDERKQIIGVINIDTIAEKSDLGYMAMIEGNKRPDDIEYDDEGLKKLAELNKNSMSDLFTSSDGFYLTMATNSDHYPFALVDIPAVSIVQDWQDGLNVNDSSDVKENMDMQRIVEVIEKVTEVLSEIPSNN